MGINIKVRKQVASTFMALHHDAKVGIKSCRDTIATCSLTLCRSSNLFLNLIVVYCIVYTYTLDISVSVHVVIIIIVITL